jgi:hypothetical protein
MTLARQAMIRFRHADAVVKPKPRRPATVADGPFGGRYSLFYGSTYKQRAPPRDAIVVDPRAPVDEPARELADHLGRVIDERTYFHGSMMSETHGSDPTIERFPSWFPADLHDELVEQSEQQLLAFREAFHRTQWLLPSARSFVLDAVWWQLGLELREESALTLLVYEGLAVSEIAALRWRDVSEHKDLLPRSRGLLERLRAVEPGGSESDHVFGDPKVTRATLRRLWDALRKRGLRARPKVVLPVWSRVPESPAM